MVRSSLKNKVVLVTGGAGFIGSHLVDRVIDEGAKEVVVIDNMFLGDQSNLRAAEKSGKLTLYRDDAEIRSSVEYIFDIHQVDIVFNCATKALNYSFINPSNAFSTNVDVILNLLEIQRSGGFKTLCHFSTSEVYGSAVYEPMNEEHPKNPTTTYAAGKAAADFAVESYVNMFNLDSFIVRPFNNYGPRQNYRGRLAGVIPTTAMRILNNKNPEIHGSGEQSRDFIFVEDTVDAVTKLYRSCAAGETFNISTDSQLSINYIISLVCAKLGYTDEILIKPRRKADVDSHIASNDKIKRLIDYSLTPFEDGLNKTLDYYISIFKKG
ncbi:NAD-dependent epimerase/dehydratase family protein [Paracoccaceae bacterium]|nr:NAD-dependent epimerase/dehydratase family protein [Paracoccaceae bacterium]